MYANVYVLLVAIVRPTWAALSDHTYATCAMKAFCIQRIWLGTRRNTSPKHQTKIPFTASSLVATTSKASLVVITSSDITKSNTRPKARRVGRTRFRPAFRRSHGSRDCRSDWVHPGTDRSPHASSSPLCIHASAQRRTPPPAPNLRVLWPFAPGHFYCLCSPDDTKAISLLIPYQQIPRLENGVSFFIRILHRNRFEACITNRWLFFLICFFLECLSFSFYNIPDVAPSQVARRMVCAA
jgi:hypothetical protein